MTRWHANNGEPRSDEAEEARTCRADTPDDLPDTYGVEADPITRSEPADSALSRFLRTNAAYIEALWRKS